MGIDMLYDIVAAGSTTLPSVLWSCIHTFSPGRKGSKFRVECQKLITFFCFLFCFSSLSLTVVKSATQGFNCVSVSGKLVHKWRFINICAGLKLFCWGVD